MKRAVSISLGSSKRNSSVEIELLGERVLIERIGTDGDMTRAAELFGELDGKVDAFGVGGTDLGLTIDDRHYRMHSVMSLIRYVEKTPIVDGSGLKNTLERGVVPYMEAQIGPPQPRRVLMTSGADRWGMSMSRPSAGRIWIVTSRRTWLCQSSAAVRTRPTAPKVFKVNSLPSVTQPKA